MFVHYVLLRSNLIETVLSVLPTKLLYRAKEQVASVEQESIFVRTEPSFTQ
jgi:hypothetical protein